MSDANLDSERQEYSKDLKESFSQNRPVDGYSNNYSQLSPPDIRRQLRSNLDSV